MGYQVSISTVCADAQSHGFIALHGFVQYSMASTSAI